ncbi:hypothetical protein ACWCQZ_50155 [Streptomyces sp. NPDC002285]
MYLSAGKTISTLALMASVGTMGVVLQGGTAIADTTSCMPAQLLNNPGFESGSTAWTESAYVIDRSTGQTARSGRWEAWLNGYGLSHVDTLFQTVHIPAGCHATLTYWLYIDSEEATSIANDKLTVKANSTSLASYSNLNESTGYRQQSFDLSSFAGQTVTLDFTGTENSSKRTSFVIDDTAITVG